MDIINEQQKLKQEYETYGPGDKGVPGDQGEPPTKRLFRKLNKGWFYAAGIRATKTVAQTALGMFTIGSALNEVNWTYVVSVSVVAGIYSLLTSIATDLPEISTDGILQVDTNQPDKDIYLLTLFDDPENLKNEKYVRLKVDPEADLSESR